MSLLTPQKSVVCWNSKKPFFAKKIRDFNGNRGLFLHYYQLLRSVILQILTLDLE